ncbi:MAG: hypothetical protein RL756_597 [Pseudomonadota bacterium]
MMRLKDWPERLAAFMDERRSMPFGWVTNDCSTFAADAVAAMTGECLQIPAADSPEAYARLIRDHGTLREMAEALLGEPIHPAYAQRGDVVLLVMDERETLGVCVGAKIAGPGTDGLVLAPMSMAVAAWRI